MVDCLAHGCTVMMMDKRRTNELADTQSQHISKRVKKGEKTEEQSSNPKNKNISRRINTRVIQLISHLNRQPHA
ncbi:unnamed protein product [Rotaria socialis]